MLKEVTCPRCGAPVHPYGLGSHLRGQPCIVSARRRELVQQGMFPADMGVNPPPQHLKELCTLAGVPAVVAPVSRSNKTTFYTTYVPYWVEALYRVLLRCAADEDDEALFTRLLQRGAQDTEFCAAVEAAAAVGTLAVASVVAMQGG